MTASAPAPATAAANPLAPPWLAHVGDLAALPAPLWPAGAARDGDGMLTLGGLRADDLVARFGSPVTVLDGDDLAARMTAAREAFDQAARGVGTEAAVYYAAKAFCATGVLAAAAQRGLGVDVCSGGELAVALAAGVDASTIGLHGNDKSDAELEAAVAAGVGTVVLDSAEEVARIARVASAGGVVQRVRIRVATGVHAETHEHLATAHEDQKFGVAPVDVPAVAAAVRRTPSLALSGLHAHIGSQVFVADGFAESARRLLGLHAALLADGDVPELNLGGGFGIAYTPDDEPPELGALASAIVAAVAEECDRLGIRIPRLAFEPGRWIAGPPGITLYTVGTVKDVRVGLPDGGVALRRYVAVDGGMADNPRPALYGARYTVRLASRVSDADAVLVRLAGRHCESGDVLVDDDLMPGDVGRGDLVALAATGAYCASLASTYNRTPRPAVVAVVGGEARVVVRREEPAELAARDAGADALAGAGRVSAASGASATAAGREARS